MTHLAHSYPPSLPLWTNFTHLGQLSQSGNMTQVEPSHSFWTTIWPIPGQYVTHFGPSLGPFWITVSPRDIFSLRKHFSNSLNDSSSYTSSRINLTFLRYQKKRKCMKNRDPLNWYGKQNIKYPPLPTMGLICEYSYFDQLYLWNHLLEPQLTVISEPIVALSNILLGPSVDYKGNHGNNCGLTIRYR